MCPIGGKLDEYCRHLILQDSNVRVPRMYDSLLCDAKTRFFGMQFSSYYYYYC